MNSCGGISPFPNKPWFLRVFKKSPFENTVGKGEIARNEQFLLFPQCFLLLENVLPFPSNLELLTANSSSLEGPKSVVWERVNSHPVTSSSLPVQ